MSEPTPRVVRMTTRQLTTPRLTGPRAVARTQRSHPPSLLPLLIPASIAAAAFFGKLFSRKKPPENTAVIEWQVEMVALVLSRPEK